MFSRAAWFALFFAVALSMSWYDGAFEGEFADNADEPAHYVTGLLVHDYVAQGFPGPPLDFARNYYLHYPKVSLGHWPPFFYLVQTAWTLPFGTSRVSLLCLMAALGALLATLIFDTLRRELSLLAGLASALLWLTLPEVQRFDRDIMAEVLVALCVFLATVSYGRYLDTERWQPAAWFGVWVALCLLTKGTGIQLAFVPPAAVLLTWRWRLITRFSFWIPPLVIALIAVPWYFWVPGAQHESVASLGGIAFLTGRIAGTPLGWLHMLGLVLATGALIGLALGLHKGNGLWIAGIGTLLGAWVCRLLIGAYEDRHLTVNLPILVMAAVLAADWLRRKLHAGPLVPAVLAALLLGFHIQAGPVKRNSGYSALAVRLIREFPSSVILVCSDAEGEGRLISEIAMHEPRPGHYVLRGTKMLASVGWMGVDYKEIFTRTDAMLGYLDSIPVGIVVADELGFVTPHGRRLVNALDKLPEKWERLASSSPGLRVYRSIGHEGRPVGKIEVLMKNGLFGSSFHQ